ncbi:MAG: calcium/sodium antiporter [Leptolyngbya sp. SIO1D8]|nr:calcium/sodium antiporter [Leptolyngbya sp. SIO1D8]
MTQLPILFLIFVVSLAVLVKASDFFTDSAEKLGIAIGLPPFIVGVTIVSMGTSLPELLSSLFGIFQGAPEVVVSNVMGSNIANICLVIGTAAIISPKSLRVMYNLVSVDLPLFMGSAFLFTLMAWDKIFSRGEALLLVIGYIMYLFYILKSSDEEATQPENSTSPDDNGGIETQPQYFTTASSLRELLILILSGIFIFLGAQYTIDSLIKIADLLNIGKEIIAISAVALGTSLPELMVTIHAARKGKAEIAIGNVVGSNIFNIFVVMGIPGLIHPLPVPEIVLRQGIPTLISASLLMFFIAQDNKVTIWEGWLFVILYIWFIGTTFNLL